MSNTNIIVFPPLAYDRLDPLMEKDFFDDNGNIRNGLGVITPAVCTCTKELRGCFELYIEVVAPDERIAEYLANWAHVAAPVLGRWDSSGKVTRKHQIFFVTSVQKSTDKDGIVTYALQLRHIFYGLSYGNVGDGWMPYHAPCSDALLYLVQGNNMYNYRINTDSTEKYYFSHIKDASKVADIMDENGILDTYGCEIHRDNFYISAFYGKKEFSKGSAYEPAFRFILGKEVTAVTESLLYPDDMASSVGVFNEDGTVFLYRIHVPPTKIGAPFGNGNIKYTAGENEKDWEIQKKAEMLLKSKAFPQHSCEVELSSIKESYEYRSIEELADCDIGDVGTVYSPATGTNITQRVTRTVEDVLKGQYTEITLGNIPGSIAKDYNNTSYIGMQKYFSMFGKTGGFTADVTVSEGKNKVMVLSQILAEISDLSCDAVVEYGDTYTHTLSSFGTDGAEHEYAYAGSYRLRYNSYFDDTDYADVLYPKDYENPDAVLHPVMATAMENAGHAGYADIDNIVFDSNVTKIGQSVTASRYNTSNVLYVQKISRGVFCSCPSIKTITIPADVRYISCIAFPECTSLKDIYYGGTVNEWKEVIEYSAAEDSKQGAVFASTSWLDTYNVTVHCTDGDTIQKGTLGVNPAYGV